MDDLKFIEKLCLNLLISNNTLGDRGINVGNFVVNNASFNILFKNKSLIKKILLKAIDNNPLESELYRLINDYIACSGEKMEEWKKLEEEVAYEYLSSNFYSAGAFPYGFELTGVFQRVVSEKIDQDEINKNEIDSIFEVYANGPELGWIVSTISILKQKGKEELFLYSVEKLKLLLQSKVKENSNISEEEKVIVFNSINQNLIRYARGGITTDTVNDIYYECIMPESKYTKTVSLARIGTDEMKDLTISQINNINVKNVKQIIEIAKQKYSNIELDNNVFYKIYLMCGKQRTLELLDGKYGEISFDKLELMFSGIDVDNYIISAKNAEPDYDRSQQALINFLFASGINDLNSNMKKILSGEISSENLPFNRLVSEWKIYYSLLGGNVVINDLMKIMDELEIVLPPNEKKISSAIKLSGIQYKNIISDTYGKMKKRTSSSIPKVKGSAGDYEYEILDLIDPIQMNVGYYTNCCFTFGGESENSLIHACTHDDSRIFVIKQNGKIVAQSWVWRNGNTICFDNIEVYGVDREAGSRFWNVYEQVSNEMISISQHMEPGNQQIQLVTIGKGFTDIDLQGEPLESEKLLFPRKEGLYTDAGDQQIIATSDNYEKPIEFDASPVYQDERQKISIVDPQQSSQESIIMINDHIDSINYSIDSDNFKQCDSESEYTFIIYGSDWFIGITTDGEIVKREYSFDERSKDEIKNALQLICDKIKSGELSNNINDVMIETIMKENSAYGK